MTNAQLTMYTTSWCGFCNRLKTALKAVRDDLKAQRDKAIDGFATDLAKELGVPKSKVDAVIDSLGHHGRRGP